MSPLIRRRRPLLRAAAVGGGAYVAGKRRAESRQREEEQEARLGQLEQEQQDAPAPQAAASPGGLPPDAIEQLRQLGELHEQGVLSDEEFAAQKARVLGA